MDSAHIGNFSIIAHIDHGRTTLAVHEVCSGCRGAVHKRGGGGQFLCHGFHD